MPTSNGGGFSSNSRPADMQTGWVQKVCQRARVATSLAQSRWGNVHGCVEQDGPLLWLLLEDFLGDKHDPKILHVAAWVERQRAKGKRQSTRGGVRARARVVGQRFKRMAGDSATTTTTPTTRRQRARGAWVGQSGEGPY